MLLDPWPSSFLTVHGEARRSADERLEPGRRVGYRERSRPDLDCHSVSLRTPGIRPPRHTEPWAGVRSTASPRS